jgi:hypothetical protein
MDENTKDVLIIAVGVLGTLLGTWLGNTLQQRHRYDDEKRQAFTEFMAATYRIRALYEDRWASLDHEQDRSPAEQEFLTSRAAPYEVMVDKGTSLQTLAGQEAIGAAERVMDRLDEVYDSLLSDGASAQDRWERAIAAQHKADSSLADAVRREIRGELPWQRLSRTLSRVARRPARG